MFYPFLLSWHLMPRVAHSRCQINVCWMKNWRFKNKSETTHFKSLLKYGTVKRQFLIQTCSQVEACFPQSWEEVQWCFCQRDITGASVSLCLTLSQQPTTFAPQPSSHLGPGPRFTVKLSSWGRANLIQDRK